MSEREPVVARPRRRCRCRSAFLATGGLAAALILAGGGLAHAAESASDTPSSVSVSWTGPDGQPVGPDGAPVTTTTIESNAPEFSDAPVTGQGASVNVPAGSGEGSASLEQTIAVSVLPGPMTVSPTAESVSFSRTGNGNGQRAPYSGDLSPITVVDARGSLVGWTATVTLQSVDGLDASQLVHARLCVSPDTRTVVAGIPDEVRTADHSCGAMDAPLTMFFAPSDGGGGTFSDTGSLTLVLPSAESGNQVTASIAVAVH